MAIDMLMGRNCFFTRNFIVLGINERENVRERRERGERGREKDIDLFIVLSCSIIVNLPIK